MKGIPFLLIVLLGITAIYTWMDLNKTRSEGFQSNAAMPPAPVPSALPSLKAGIEPTTSKPGVLPSAPYNATAATSPDPYIDPALTPVTFERIQTVIDGLKGFLSFEAPLLRGQSDPTIQLPLSTSKADLPRLESELVALRRNPGLNSSLSAKDILDVEGNLRYLRDKFRILHASGAIQGQPTSFLDSAVPGTIVEGYTDNASMMPNLATPEERATLMDLRSARERMMAEQARLNASGTNDPVIAARTKAISNMIEELISIINKVQTGVLSELEIPIMKNDISNVFRAIQNPREPIPALVGNALPPAALNLLPPGLTKDAESQAMLRGLADKYIGGLMNGLSWKVEATAKYMSPNEALSKSKINIQFAPPVNGEDSMIGLNRALGSSTYGFPTQREMALSGTSINAQPTPAPGNPSDPYAINPIDGMGRTPSVASGFDWKRRAKEICENIRRRGMNPKDFGCMEPGAQVSNNFSWRGHAKMICTRLQSDYYTGTAEACGCPPMNWKGWDAIQEEAERS
jgi:hypothetical protein